MKTQSVDCRHHDLLNDSMIRLVGRIQIAERVGAVEIVDEENGKSGYMLHRVSCL